MLHHYLEYVDEDTIAEAEVWSADLSELYADLETHSTHLQGSHSPDYSACRGRHDDGRFKCPTLFPSF